MRSRDFSHSRRACESLGVAPAKRPDSRTQPLKMATRVLQLGRDRSFRFAARLSSRGLPGALLPEILQIRLIPAENVALRPFNIGHTYGVSRAREAAFTVATVLPESPVVPRRRCARLLM